MAEPTPLEEENGSAVLGSGLECVACLVRQAQEAIALTNGSPENRAATLRQVLRWLEGSDWHRTPPALGQEMHRLIRQATRCPDPYAAVKEELNQRAAKLRPYWSRRFKETHPPLEAAVRLAIVGNLLDVGAKTQMDESGLKTAFEDSLWVPLVGSIQLFADAIRQARRILYLADNAGEIVFDRDLLAQLPPGRCTLAVRGAPVLNDATRTDVEWAGLTECCEIIDNGSDAPGTLLEDCSPEFRERFEAVDLIIAKGQGNYESLAHVSKPIFFLLKVKCPVLGRALSCPVGSLVLRGVNVRTAQQDMSMEMEDR